jgi:SOS response regulatory protein OraA/RecX
MANPVNTNQQLADHIKKNVAKGYTMDSLRFSLLQQGYSRTSIEKAIDIANKQLAEQAPKMVEKPVIKFQTIDDNEMAAKIAAQDSANTGFFKKIFGWFRK